MGHDLQALSDRLDIQDLLHRYTQAVDTRDWGLYRSCFTADATIDYTASGGARGTLEEVTAWISETLSMFSMTQHFVTNTLLIVTGDQATGRSYFYNPMILAGDGPAQHLIVGGYYNDLFRRDAHGWRIAERIEEMAFMDGPFTRT